MIANRWTGGDAISSALIDLTAGRGLTSGTAVRPHLIELAQRHGLSGLLAEVTDDPLARATYSRMDMRRSVMLGHLRRILERLDAAGVRAAVLKGPEMATRYREPAHRIFSDLDILIEEKSLERGLDVLATDEAFAGVPERRPRADKRDVIFRDRRGVAFNVDVHWDLFAYSQLRGTASGANEEGWRAASPTPDSPFGPHWVLPASTEICFLAAHAILDHRFRLILLRDFVEIAEGEVAWEQVLETAGRWGLRASTYVPLWMARHSVGAAVCSEVLDSLRTPSLVVSYLEYALPKVDLVRFDGHSTHPVNLASVLLGDTATHRLALAARVPGAFPKWRKRVASEQRTVDAPRVLIVVNSDRRRGAEVFAERLSQGLMELGLVVDSVSLTTIGSGARVDVTPLTRLSPDDAGRLEPEIVKALRERVKSFGADVVLATGGATLRYGVLANLGLRSRLVYLGIGEPGYWLRSRYSTILNRMLLRRADQVLAVSSRTKQELIELEPALENRIDVAYTGVPDALFRLDGRWPEGPLRVVMIGSLSSEKDPELALRAVAAVEGVMLRFVGEGPLEGRLREVARQLDAEDRVEFTGSVDDVAPQLSWADLLILTSRTEGLPGAIIEAGAAGVPAVSVDVGGVEEAIESGVSGIIVPPRDLQALSGAVEELASDPDRLVRMGHAARSHVRARFSMDRSVSHYADALIGAVR